MNYVLKALIGRVGIAVLLLSCGLFAIYGYTHKIPITTLSFPASGLLNTSSKHQYDRALRSSIHSFQDRTQIELGIILQAHLPADMSIEEFSARRFQESGLGQHSSQGALLFVWSEQEQLFKIEVGYQLESVFPDALCRRLEQSARTFMLSKTPYAMRDFLTEIIVTMGITYLDYKRTGQLADMLLPVAANSNQATMSQYFSGGAGIVGRGYAATAEQVRLALPRLSPELERTMQADAVLETVLQRYFESLALGLGTPQLPLLSEGSRFYRIEKPHASAYLQRMHRYYQKSSPYKIMRHGGLAAVVFPDASPVQPILLQQGEDGLWRIDEAKAWAYFHLYEDGSSHPKFAQGPFAFAWQADQSVYRDRIIPPELSVKAHSLTERIAQLEADIAREPLQASHYVKLAELLQFEMYWIEAAAPLYEKALQLAPSWHELDWRLIDIYANTTDIDNEEKHYLALLKKTPDDILLQHYYQWFQKNYPQMELAAKTAS